MTATRVRRFLHAVEAARVEVERETSAYENTHPDGAEVLIALQLADGSTFHVEVAAVRLERPGMGEPTIVLAADLSSIPSLQFVSAAEADE